METSRCLRIGADGFISRCGKQYRRDKVRPASTVDGGSAKPFAQRGQNGPKWTSIACWASFFAPTGTVSRPRSPPSAPRPGRSVRACPPDRRNLLRTRIGYRHPANLSAWAQVCPRVLAGSSPVEWCNRFVSFGLGYALSWSGVSSCWVGWGVSRDLVRMSRLR